MDSKYIFVPYDGRFDANIILRGKFYILHRRRKKGNISSACYLFQIYELYFSTNTDPVSDERVEKQGFGSQQQNFFEQVVLTFACVYNCHPR